MKKLHLALLIVAFITATASVYSLAAINQVYSIDFDWYSTFKKAYLNEDRDLSRDKWQLEGEVPELKLGVTAIGIIESGIKQNNYGCLDIDFNKYIMVWATMGEVSSPEYSIRISSIAQRGEVVEIVLSLNSPAKIWDKDKEFMTTYYPFDVVRINRLSFATRGKMIFIFKDQTGKQLFTEQLYI